MCQYPVHLTLDTPLVACHNIFYIPAAGLPVPYPQPTVPLIPHEPIHCSRHSYSYTFTYCNSTLNILFCGQGLKIIRSGILLPVYPRNCQCLIVGICHSLHGYSYASVYVLSTLHCFPQYLLLLLYPCPGFLYPVLSIFYYLMEYLS